MTPLQTAIEKAGGPAEVASLLGCSIQAVCFWRDGSRRFPAEHCAALEAASGISRRDLRPSDWWRIWPELVNKRHPIPNEVAAAGDA